MISGPYLPHEIKNKKKIKFLLILMIVKEDEDIEWKIVLQKKSHLLNLVIKHFKLIFYHLMLISDDLTK